MEKNPSVANKPAEKVDYVNLWEQRASPSTTVNMNYYYDNDSQAPQTTQKHLKKVWAEDKGGKSR